jgi:RNA-directed DNA polymerase
MLLELALRSQITAAASRSTRPAPRSGFRRATPASDAARRGDGTSPAPRAPIPQGDGAGEQWLLVWDIRRGGGQSVEWSFNSIPHAKLLKLISLRISDGSMLELIKQSLKVGVSDKGVVTPTRRGVPQGSPISPLYSNIYLNLLDQLWHKRGYPEKLQATLYRYCDDAILVCRKSAYPALEAFKSIAKRMELTLNEDKTHITKLTDGIDFIGYQFVKRPSPKTGKNTIYIFPAKRAQQKIRNRLKYLTSRRAPVSPKEFIELVNPVVRGWTNYFLHTNASDAFRRLQRFINTRFRRYLTFRRKGRGFGWRRHPNSKLYAMGLIYIGSGLLEYTAKPAHGSR